MKSTIALIGSGSPQGIILKTGISASTFNRYGILCDRLSEFQDFDAKLSIVSASARILEEKIKELTSIRSEVFNNRSYEENLHQLNNATRTFLGDMKMFLDHAQSRLDRTYGKDSLQYQAFKKATAHEFDNSFAYRFCYHLRNALHADNPFLNMPESQKIVDGELQCQTKIFFDSRDLLSRFTEWHSIVRADLQAMNEFQAEGLFYSVVDSIRRINSAIFISERDILFGYGTEMKAMVQEALDQNLLPLMGRISLDTKMYEEQTVKMRNAPVKTLERLGLIRTTFRG